MKRRKTFRIDYRDYVAETLKEVVKDGLILEVGTGFSHMTEVLSDYGLNVITVDVEKENLEACKEELGYQVEVVSCDCTALPFRENSFRAVVADQLISSLQEVRPFSHLKFLSEVKRVLSRGGLLFLIDYGEEEEPLSRRDEIAIKAWRLYKAVMDLLGEKHYEEVPLDVLVYWLKQAGFEVIAKERVMERKEMDWKEDFIDFVENLLELLDELDEPLRNAFLEEVKRLALEARREGVSSWSDLYMIVALRR